MDIWILLAVNGCFVAFQMLNAWMVAFYMKRPTAPKGKTPEGTAPLPWLLKWANPGIFILALCALVLSIWQPNPDLTQHVLKIALSIGFMVHASVMSRIDSLQEGMRLQDSTIRKLVDGQALMVDALERVVILKKDKSESSSQSKTGNPE